MGVPDGEVAEVDVEFRVRRLGVRVGRRQLERRVGVAGHDVEVARVREPDADAIIFLLLCYYSSDDSARGDGVVDEVVRADFAVAAVADCKLGLDEDHRDAEGDVGDAVALDGEVVGAVGHVVGRDRDAPDARGAPLAVELRLVVVRDLDEGRRVQVDPQSVRCVAGPRFVAALDFDDEVFVAPFLGYLEGEELVLPRGAGVVLRDLDL
mmetsp:Transcript_14906/g.48657  ORF Transcript_14906/g.48657 Transcript_14906/m.48657 type:complete len:209 (-) Transcript_14906:1818-2444(-)